MARKRLHYNGVSAKNGPREEKERRQFEKVVLVKGRKKLSFLDENEVEERSDEHPIQPKDWKTLIYTSPLLHGCELRRQATCKV